jgi:hypothetical protein
MIANICCSHANSVRQAGQTSSTSYVKFYRIRSTGSPVMRREHENPFRAIMPKNLDLLKSVGTSYEINFFFTTTFVRTFFAQTNI